MKSKKHSKIIRFISIICIFITLIFCGCNSKADSESKIQEYENKLVSLNSELEHYQGIYDEALTTYQQYKKYSGSPEWDSELTRTKEIMQKANTEISEIKRQIALYERFKQSEERKLEE